MSKRFLARNAPNGRVITSARHITKKPKTAANKVVKNSMKWFVRNRLELNQVWLCVPGSLRGDAYVMESEHDVISIKVTATWTQLFTNYS